MRKGVNNGGRRASPYMEASGCRDRRTLAIVSFISSHFFSRAILRFSINCFFDNPSSSFLIGIVRHFVTMYCASIRIFVLHVLQSHDLHEHSILMYSSFYFSIFTDSYDQLLWIVGTTYPVKLEGSKEVRNLGSAKISTLSLWTLKNTINSTPNYFVF